MKLLYLTNLPAPYRVAFFNELGTHVDLTVLYQRKTAADRDRRWQADDAKNFKEVYLGGMALGAAASLSPRVLTYLKDRSYDAIIVGGYSTPTEMLAISYLKRKKIPYLLSVDGGVPRADTGFKKRLKTFLISGASQYLSTGTAADECLCSCGADQNRLLHYHFTSLYEKDILPTAPTQEEKNALKSALGLPCTPIVLAVGRLLDWKRYDLLINAAARLKSVQFLIVGGMADAYHEALLKKAKVKNVSFIDFMQYNSLSRYYRAADVFAMPSDADPWGLVVQEAMAHGLPVVASTGCGAARDLVVPQKNGMLFEKGDVNALLCALFEILISPQLREEYGKNSLTMIKEYTIEQEVSDHLNALERLHCG